MKRSDLAKFRVSVVYCHQWKRVDRVQFVVRATTFSGAASKAKQYALAAGIRPSRVSTVERVP